MDTKVASETEVVVRQLAVVDGPKLVEICSATLTITGITNSTDSVPRTTDRDVSSLRATTDRAKVRTRTTATSNKTTKPRLLKILLKPQLLTRLQVRLMTS